jgi:transposase
VEWIAKTDPKLYRAYKLKEALRLVFYNDTVEEASEALTAWIKWARHCRIPAFVELQKKIVRHQSLVAMGTGSMGILLLHLTGYLA